jgi:hypothetical protein
MTAKHDRLVVGLGFFALGLLFVSGCSVPEQQDTPGPTNTAEAADAEKDEESSSGFYIAVGCVLFLAVGSGVLMVRTRKAHPGGGGPAEGLLYFRCTECKKKISYSRKRVGQQAPCPACGAKFTFPAPSKDVTTSPGKTAMKTPGRKLGR